MPANVLATITLVGGGDDARPQPAHLVLFGLDDLGDEPLDPLVRGYPPLSCSAIASSTLPSRMRFAMSATVVRTSSCAERIRWMSSRSWAGADVRSARACR